MKVVLNRCYGGFGISIAALKELVNRSAKCIVSKPPKDWYGGRPGWEKEWDKDLAQYNDMGEGLMGEPSEFNILKGGLLHYLEDRNEQSMRTNPDLVDVVEKMGKESWGQCAELEVVEIPDGIQWEINDYDGMESIHEMHRRW